MGKEKFVALDGLRGVAALLVVLYHYQASVGYEALMPSGYLAVDLFFLISGFVIGHAYEWKLLNQLTFRAFIEIRLIRLYPLFIMGCMLSVICSFFAAVQSSDWYQLKQQLKALAFNAFFLPVPFWSDRGAYPLNFPAWTLFFELLINFIYAWLVRRLSTLVLLVVLVVSTSASFIGAQVHATADYASAGGPDMLWGLARVTTPFTMGLLLYRGWKSDPSRFPRVPAWMSVALFCATLFFPRTGKGAAAAATAIVVVGQTAIVALAIGSRPTGWLEKLFKALGALSYPLYALHIPIFATVAVFLVPERVSLVNAGLLAAVATLAASTLAIGIDRRIGNALRKFAGLRRRDVQAAPSL